jgi:hypothetical protein
MFSFDPHDGVKKIEGGNMNDLFQSEKDANTLFVADAVPPTRRPYSRKHRVILITSPDRDVWYEFEKQCRGVQLYLPLWSYDEIVTYCRKMGYRLSGEEIAEKMKWIGGTVRNLDTDTTKLKANIPFQFSPDSFESILLQKIEWKAGSSSHRLVHIDVPFDKKKGRHQFRKYNLVFASDTIQEIVLNGMKKIELSRLGPMLSLCSGGYTDRTVSGILFEHIAHRILERGGTFTCTSLEENESDKRSTMSITLGPTEHGARVFKEDGDILGMKDQYCVPHVPNFPAFDAAYYPYLFQMTIRKEHPVTSMHKALQKVSSFPHLTSADFQTKVKKCFLIFVVPSEIANEWTKKQHFGGDRMEQCLRKHIKQFVLPLD